MTFLAHETLHMSSLDQTNGMLCLERAQDPHPLGDFFIKIKKLNHAHQELKL
jgi:hypothetical protein